MISLLDKNLEEAKKYHGVEANVIFDKIINNKIGKDKLNENVRKLLKKYKNILIKGKPHLLLKVNEKYINLGLTDAQKKDVKDFFQKTVYPNHFQNNHGKEFLNKLGIDTCIYCNRNYTIDFISLNNARAELDHWFPKSEFPILALSFYNLIPSCHSCNHIKGEGDTIVKKILNNGNATDKEIQKWWNEKALIDLNHPYLNSSEFKFTWFFDGSLNKTKVDFRVIDSKMEKTLEFNKAKEIYNAHSNRELKDLLDLRYKYSENYIDILINKTFTNLAFSKEEIYRMVFGIETREEDYHKRPFSKFKHDIIEELKNIK